MKRIASLLAVGAAALPLASCVENSSGGDLTVTATSDKCEVSATSADSGARTFSIKNEGSQITEFYLLADDGLRVVAERENIAPGETASLTVSLAPGNYYTACKPGLRGPNVGQAAFTVTGEAIAVDADDQERFDAAVTSYTQFTQNEVAALVPAVQEFAAAYAAGQDDRARELYPATRVHYERIEPLAEALGILDAKIDYREIDYIAEADHLAAEDPSFTEWRGFHRIEKDLWVPAEDATNADGSPARLDWAPSTREQRQKIADQLVSDVETLESLVRDANFAENNDVTIDTISNGAIGLLEEIATNKVTGEENWWSHKDLYDFQSNLEGARIAFDLVAPIAADRGEEGTKLVDDITTRFDAVQELLNKYGSAEQGGFPDYTEVNAGQQAELTRAIDALREPLSQLTGTVLGI
ncbi:Efem/EfeO family lipoprotein precursor [Corynebacterium capitovis DSM 44611]|uniref:iron uptake system protein EfeO n=1 Tax=Corynebacterium capitovis TaxID=131081 RepID=UPI000363846E|nr:iron uptake system protein EfeO [Corynebacterium capitovis]WKD57160.1 Efem/EfeO family lipoprotein precursor [Corynebacterium capitovis DSM 44611]